MQIQDCYSEDLEGKVGKLSHPGKGGIAHAVLCQMVDSSVPS